MVNNVAHPLHRLHHDRLETGPLRVQRLHSSERWSGLDFDLGFFNPEELKLSSYNSGENGSPFDLSWTRTALLHLHDTYPSGHLVEHPRFNGSLGTTRIILSYSIEAIDELHLADQLSHRADELFSREEDRVGSSSSPCLLDAPGITLVLRLEGGERARSELLEVLRWQSGWKEEDLARRWARIVFEPYST